MLDNRPKISILIPVYNREKIILETIKSIQNQTYGKCILVDDGSTDASLEILNAILQEDSRFKL